MNRVYWTTFMCMYCTCTAPSGLGLGTTPLTDADRGSSVEGGGLSIGSVFSPTTCLFFSFTPFVDGDSDSFPADGDHSGDAVWKRKNDKEDTFYLANSFVYLYNNIQMYNQKFTAKPEDHLYGAG